MLPDLEGTPWRAIVLSEPKEVWCLVDAVDYPWLAQWKWNIWWSGRSGARWQLYAKRNTGPRRDTIRMHREILTRFDPYPPSCQAEMHGDHRNRQTLDNRRANLRWLTREANARNCGPRAQIPSLESIVGELIEGWRAEHRQLEDVPF